MYWARSDSTRAVSNSILPSELLTPDYERNLEACHRGGGMPGIIPAFRE